MDTSVCDSKQRAHPLSTRQKRPDNTIVTFTHAIRTVHDHRSGLGKGAMMNTEGIWSNGGENTNKARVTSTALQGSRRNDNVEDPISSGFTSEGTSDRNDSTFQGLPSPNQTYTQTGDRKGYSFETLEEVSHLSARWWEGEEEERKGRKGKGREWERMGGNGREGKGRKEGRKEMGCIAKNKKEALGGGCFSPLAHGLSRRLFDAFLIPFSLSLFYI